MIYCNWQSLSNRLICNGLLLDCLLIFCGQNILWSNSVLRIFPMNRWNNGMNVRPQHARVLIATGLATSSVSRRGLVPPHFRWITWPGDLIWSMFVLLICYIHSSLLITADLEYPPKKQFSTGWIHMFLGWVETTKQWWSLIFRKNSSIDTISWSSPHLLRSSRVGFQEAIAVLTWK